MSEDDAVREACATAIRRYGYTVIVTNNDDIIKERTYANKWKYCMRLHRVHANPLHDVRVAERCAESVLINLEHVAAFYGVVITQQPIYLCSIIPQESEYFGLYFAVDDIVLTSTPCPPLKEEDEAPFQEILNQRLAATQKAT
jgi:hypothetical protein